MCAGPWTQCVELGRWKGSALGTEGTRPKAEESHMQMPKRDSKHARIRRVSKHSRYQITRITAYLQTRAGISPPDLWDTDWHHAFVRLVSRRSLTVPTKKQKTLARHIILSCEILFLSSLLTLLFSYLYLVLFSSYVLYTRSTLDTWVKQGHMGATGRSPPPLEEPPSCPTFT